MADDHFDPEAIDYTFSFSRVQFAYILIGSAFVCMTFFIFGYKLGQRLKPAEVRAEQFRQLPTPDRPIDETGAYVVGADLGPTATPDSATLVEEEFRQLDEFERPSPAPTVREVLPTDPPEPTDPPVPTDVPPPTFTPNPEPTPKTAQPAVDDGYTIQIASFSEKENADGLVARLREQNFDAYIMQINLTARDVRYRVRVGRFPTKAEADRVLGAVQRNGYRDAFISRLD